METVEIHLRDDINLLCIDDIGVHIRGPHKGAIRIARGVQTANLHSRPGVPSPRAMLRQGKLLVRSRLQYLTKQRAADTDTKKTDLQAKRIWTHQADERKTRPLIVAKPILLDLLQLIGHHDADKILPGYVENRDQVRHLANSIPETDNHGNRDAR